MIRTILVLLVLITFSGVSATGAIYRCVGDDAVVLYAQFPCANAEPIAEPRVNVIKIPELSKSERFLLKRINQKSLAMHQQNIKRAKRRHRTRANHQATRTALCQQAITGIKSLRVRKRAGYSLSESTALDSREAELRQQRAENC